MVADLRGYVSPGHGGRGEHNGRSGGPGRPVVASGYRPGPPGQPVRPAVSEGSAGPFGAGAAYCPMLAIDLTSFSDRSRGETVQRFLRAAMYDLLMCAFDRSRLTWVACHSEDRGDGVLVVVPPGVPATTLIDPLVDHVRAGIRLHNKICSDLAKIRLRMSVHAGQVHFDDNGVCGYAVIHLFRMLDAPAFKRAFAASGADFALVTSDAFYEDVISQGPGLIDPDMYAPINIRSKETRGRGWLYLPPVRNPFLRAVSGSRRQASRAAGTTAGEQWPARPATRARTAAPGGGPQATPGATPQATPSVTPQAMPGASPQAQPPAGSAGSLPAPIPLQRSPRQPDERKDRVPALAGLIAASAATRSRWLASVPRSAQVPSRVRERLQPGYRTHHLGR